MKKLFVHILLISPALFLFNSCIAKVDNNSAQEARELFNQSATVTLQYINYIKAANDSLEVDSILERFDKKITEINFNFPPQTDYKLTDQENDSLFNLISILNQEKVKKLSSLAITLAELDSIE